MQQVEAVNESVHGVATLSYGAQVGHERHVITLLREQGDVSGVKHTCLALPCLACMYNTLSYITQLIKICQIRESGMSEKVIMKVCHCTDSCKHTHSNEKKRKMVSK